MERKVKKGTIGRLVGVAALYVGTLLLFTNVWAVGIPLLVVAMVKLKDE